MGNKIYILCNHFVYGTAIANRLLAYAKGFKECGFSIEIIGLREFAPKDYVSEKGIHIRGNFATRASNRYLCLLLSYLFVLKFLFLDLKKNSITLLYGCREYLPLFAKFKKGKIFNEMTEHPDVVTSKIVSTKNFNKACKKLDGMFVISRPLKRYFSENGINNIHIINMIVDKERFDNVEINNCGCKYLAYCGNICDDSKDGVSELLRAFTIYHKCFIDRKLYIAGPIKSQKQKKIYEDFAFANGIGDYVSFLGAVSPNEMPKLLSNAEMLLLTRPNNKQAHYGFPTKLGEYLLSKRPVVVSRVGDIDAFLIDGVNAVLVQPDDIAEIANKMMWVSNNPSESNELGLKGYDCAISNFNNLTEVKKMLHAFGM
jgi:glycosyltransferase involved in cell wall biosynthesis